MVIYLKKFMIDFLIVFIGIFAKLYSFALLAYVIISWFPSPGNSISYFLGSIVSPALSFVKRFIPPMGFIDLSPIVLFLMIDLGQFVLIHFLLYLKDLI